MARICWGYSINYSPYKFSCKFAFISCLPFRINQKQDSNLQQVGFLPTRNISGLCLQPVRLFFEGILNSIGFYKRILLHVIPALITVPLVTKVCSLSPSLFCQVLYFKCKCSIFVLVQWWNSEQRWKIPCNTIRESTEVGENG